MTDVPSDAASRSGEPREGPAGQPRADRRQRAARNQALFREVNERINDVNNALVPATRVVQIVCECADTSCAVPLEVSAELYEAVRQHPNRFIVERDHVDADVERIVEATNGLAIVEKLEPGAQTARATDPRSR